MYQFVYWKKVVDIYDIGSIRKFTSDNDVFLCTKLSLPSQQILNLLSFHKIKLLMIKIIEKNK